MKTKTLYSEQYVECEVDVHFSDLLELIESCDEKEKSEIRKILGYNTYNNLEEQQKFELLETAMKKYNYNELQQRLDIKFYEIL